MISFTASGYIRVLRNGQELSRHRVEREAVESCARFGPGRYELHFPVVRVDVTGQTAGELNLNGTI